MYSLFSRIAMLRYVWYLHREISQPVFLLKDLIDPVFHEKNNAKWLEKVEKDHIATVEKVDFIRSNMAGASLFPDRFSLIDFALNSLSLDGFMAEFGVYTGLSLNYIARKRSEVIHGFGSFQGLPESWRGSFPEGTFKVSGHDLPQFETNVRIWKGLFSDTIPGFVEEVGAAPASFVHIDCDL